MERSLYKEWMGAMKSSLNLLATDDEVKMYSATITKILKGREKEVTSITMASKGVKALMSPLLKTYDLLEIEAGRAESSIRKLWNDKYKKTKKSDERTCVEDANKLTATFYETVENCDMDGGVNVLSRFEVIPTGAIGAVEKTWKKLMSVGNDKKSPSSLKKQLDKHKSVEKLLKLMKGQALKVQVAANAIAGHNARQGRYKMDFEEPSRFLAGILKHLVASDAAKKKDASDLLKHLVAIQSTVKNYQTPQ